MVILGFLTNLAQQLARKKSKNPKFLVFGKYGRTQFYCRRRSAPRLPHQPTCQHTKSASGQSPIDLYGTMIGNQKASGADQSG